MSRDILTPVHLDGLCLLVTPFPREELNPPDDRKSAQPSPGVTCLGCPVDGHAGGQFYINPDARPERRRMRLDMVSLRDLVAFLRQLQGRPGTTR